MHDKGPYFNDIKVGFDEHGKPYVKLGADCSAEIIEWFEEFTGQPLVDTGKCLVVGPVPQPNADCPDPLIKCGWPTDVSS